MIKLQNMLMIGSAGRNVGKTELACSLIKKQGPQHDIVGVKVTTIQAKDGLCPRGGKGCGVCSSLEGEYFITEETDRKGVKDTSRLLAAGAKRVLWLRVMRSHLNEGVEALLDLIGRDALMICESNSLRRAVEPGIFLMVEESDSERYKQSAKSVREYVDTFVHFDGNQFDLELNDVSVVNNSWALRNNATAIVLAGGKSTRMGEDKSMLLVEGRPMVEIVVGKLRPYFQQILIAANDTEKYSFLRVEVVPDKVRDRGPIMGIYSALEHSSHDLNFIIACDIPDFDMGFVREMLRQSNGYDGVVPVSGDGLREPLFAVYTKKMLEPIDRALSCGKRKVSSVFDLCNVKYIKLEDASWLKNLNTAKDYEDYVSSKG